MKMQVMKVEDIKISESFAATTPNEKKMEECRRYWKTNSKQDRYIVVNKDSILIDGYIQYLILKEEGILEAEVIKKESKTIRYRRKREGDWDIPTYRTTPTTYVYGYHPNDKNYKKEYIWRIPNNWVWVAENIQVGDVVYGRTKFGVSPIVITHITVSDKCPFDGVVKKICSKSIKRDGQLVE